MKCHVSGRFYDKHNYPQAFAEVQLAVFLPDGGLAFDGTMSTTTNQEGYWSVDIERGAYVQFRSGEYAFDFTVPQQETYIT